MKKLLLICISSALGGIAANAQPLPHYSSGAGNPSGTCPGVCFLRGQYYWQLVDMQPERRNMGAECRRRQRHRHQRVGFLRAVANVPGLHRNNDPSLSHWRGELTDFPPGNRGVPLGHFVRTVLAGGRRSSVYSAGHGRYRHPARRQPSNTDRVYARRRRISSSHQPPMDQRHINRGRPVVDATGMRGSFQRGQFLLNGCDQRLQHFERHAWRQQASRPGWRRTSWRRCFNHFNLRCDQYDRNVNRQLHGTGQHHHGWHNIPSDRLRSLHGQRRQRQRFQDSLWLDRRRVRHGNRGASSNFRHDRDWGGVPG